ncbi:MAG: DNA internalization-related competence protein ComEC/Rec2 [Candidatus Limnocylindrales bacterium]
MSRATWLAVGAITGALLAGAFPDLLAVVGTSVAIGLLAILARSSRPAAAFAAAACALVLIRAAVSLALAAPAAAAGVDSEFVSGFEHGAVVISLSAPAAGAQKAVLELRPPDSADRLFATLPRYPEIAPGDVVRFGAALEPAPDDDGFGAYLARSGIRYTAQARTLERVGEDGSPLAALELLRRGAADTIAIGLPEPEAGLAGAMSIGIRDLVSREVTSDFRISGLSHVVAISGWHIAMLGAVVGGMLRGIGRRPRTILVLLAISAYAFFAGASPSILRAAVMASVVLLARESGRRGSASAALSLTVAGMAVLDPAAISDVGFQLSAAATAGLLVWGTRTRDWMAKRLPRRTPRWLVESFAVSTAAQAATMPLVLFHFGSVSVVAPLANLLIAPLVAPAMLLTAVAFVCGAAIGLGVPAILFAPFAICGSLVIGAMIAIAHLCAGLPLATVAIPPPVNLIAAAVCAAALAVKVRAPRVDAAAAAATERVEREPSAAPTHSRRRVAAAGAASALAVLLVFANGARADGRLHLTVLDVGQGDSILIKGPSGGRALVDGGPDPDRLVALLDSRIPLWDRRIDLVVLTHPHEDHVAGLAAVLERYRVGEVVEPGMVGPGPGDAAYRRELAQTGRQSRVVAAGDSLWLDGIRMDVRWPIRGTVPLRPPDTGTAVNNVSIVLDLHFGDRRLVLAGDVEQQVDPQLLVRGLAADPQPIDVLKVAHHGSGTATTGAFVEAAAPSVAVISAGWGNPYGHPSAKTVDRLRDSGAKVFRTDLDGSVDISTDGRDLVANAGGGRPHPPTRPPPTPPGVGFCPIGPQATGRRRTYNRPDVDPLACGGGPDPPRLRTTRLVAHAFRGRGRYRVVPGHADRGQRTHDQRPAGRGCGAPA